MKENNFENENNEINNEANKETEEIEFLVGQTNTSESDDIEEAGMRIEIHAGMPESLPEKKKSNVLKEIREWVFSIAFALVLVALIKGFLFDFIVVDGRSMQTTLMHGDRLILTKLGYEPQKGDIVVLDANYKVREAYIAYQKETKGEDFGWFDEFKLRHFIWEQKKYGIAPLHYVKRVIALEGDVIDINNYANVVFVNGKKIDEPYLGDVRTYRGSEIAFPYEVGEDHAFVMGDNREDSRDSRFLAPGAIPYEAILGKATFRFWPFNAIGVVK